MKIHVAKGNSHCDMIYINFKVLENHLTLAYMGIINTLYKSVSHPGKGRKRRGRKRDSEYIFVISILFTNEAGSDTQLSEMSSLKICITIVFHNLT